MSIFRDLLAIKSFRENKAEVAVRRQREQLAEAFSAHQSSERVLQEFRDFAVQHERSLYAQLCSRIVKLRDIEDVQLAVVDLRSQESRHQDSLTKAAERRNQASVELELRKKAHGEARQMKQKFVELAQVFADEQIKELERKEDAEMEEVAETRRDRDDSDALSEEPT